MHGQPGALVDDAEGAIQMFMDHHPGLRVTATLGAGEELDQVFLEADGVVVGDRAFVLEAADVVERHTGRHRAIRGVRIGRGVGKASIVPWEERGEDGVGLGARARVRTAEFTDQAILEGAPEALDAAFGLGGGGRDPADAEFAQGPTELGRELLEAA